MTETLFDPAQEGERTFTRIDFSNVERSELPDGVQEHALSAELVAEFDQYELPQGYGLVGGAARDLALGVLAGEGLPVRDVDVVAFSDLGADLSPDIVHAVSARLMPDDYVYGHGVKPETLDNYFATRDFTMNEVAVVGGRLLTTPEAEIALRQGIIQPTKYEHDPEAGRYLSPKLAIKSVLFQSVLENEGFDTRVEGFSPADYRFRTTNGKTWDDYGPFFVALGFQKALEHGPEVARDFLDRLVGYGMVSQESITDRTNGNRLADFARNLSEATKDFEFRGEAATWLHENVTTSIGDMLDAISPDVIAEYERFHDMAQDYGGKGRKYTDESKY